MNEKIDQLKSYQYLSLCDIVQMLNLFDFSFLIYDKTNNYWQHKGLFSLL